MTSGRATRSMRVVSLVPSVTETLLGWGIEPVACTRFCEQPDLRHVGGTKDPDIGAIVELRPDLVVVDREENRREDADALVAAGCAVHVMHVTSVGQVERELSGLAGRLGIEPSIPLLPPLADAATESARRAFVPIWRRPWMTINAHTYGASLLTTCGVTGMFADHAERYPTVTLEEAAQGAPDMVVLPSEPYPFTERHIAEVTTVADDVRLVDGRDLFWWGVRTPGAIERLTRALSPRPRTR